MITGVEPRMQRILVSVLMPVLNEEAHIREVLERALAQEGAGPLEILVVDGRSTDQTKKIVAEIAARDPRVRLLDNPAGSTPNGLNVGLRAARGMFVARMDGHSRYPSTYLATGIERLVAGDVAWVSGPAVPEGDGTWSEPISYALASRLGMGGTNFRRVTEETLIASGFAGIAHRDLVRELGGWDEGWPANQDAELAARIAKRGGRVVYLPEMGARYTPRNSLKALSRQYRRWGFYRSKTSLRHPETLRVNHLIPPSLVIVVAAALVPSRVAWLARGGLAAYALCLIGTIGQSKRRANATVGAATRVPVALAVMHFSWGLGFVVGCVRHGPPLAGLRLLTRRLRAPRRSC